ncbi:DUF262 domain-containing protein [Microvirga sp. STS02]|uniref:DUF262 domain-containing protein n=1 Tax=Hymenobacter negativus TaxID=2795026 RepID=UPI0018DD1171|nr:MULTISPECIES: DUF262 domain-containing protein [Bacteria]MBH8567666.1 DUF262 domain-containing protein [Hymenobacter negativus]MBR7207400.1 DUF262 domain-containing protein [Microvirga sp. STS02]
MDISPDKQSIDKVFSNTTYHIDFYQRQYKWTKEPVLRLLDDVYYRFNEEYRKHHDTSLDLEKEVSKYAWYYLNTYVTNKVENKLYVVDGQQRLTTLTLILICLYHQANEYSSELNSWLSSKIIGQAGFKKSFWMHHEAHLAALESLYKGQRPFEKIDVSSGITARNMVHNYEEVEKWLRPRLDSQHKFESFVIYFLNRLVLINLEVGQTDVPMVFEVINDRGVRLKPYEILKGKLLGQLSKEELEQLKLNELWESQVDAINNLEENAIDSFFLYYLRGKLANTIGEAKRYDQNNYHRAIFEDAAQAYFNLSHHPKQVTQFLTHDFLYFTKLYAKLVKYSKKHTSEQPHVHFNGLNEIGTQFLLILAACRCDDPEEAAKIQVVSYQIDRLFCLLQLQRSYDSNAWAQAMYRISAKIREQPAARIQAAFDEELLNLLSLTRGAMSDTTFSYGLFKDAGIELNRRFKRYFFARVDEFIAVNTNVGLKHTVEDLVNKTGPKTGFHVEHILSYNDDNRRLFNNDEEVFERERNRLGGLLLLKGKDNISSSNEPYNKKLESYAGSLLWNETLREDAYKSKKDFLQMMSTYNLNFKPLSTFGPVELEDRHKLLFDIASIIWK